MSAWRLAGGIVVLVSGSLLAWLLRYGTAVVLPAFQADFGADAAALGALAAAYFWPYAAMQPFSGVLSDTWGPRRTLAVWLAVAAAGTAIFALAPTYEVALVGRALGGAGVGIVLVVAFSLLGQWFGTERFGTIAGLYAATGPLGGLLAAPARAAAPSLGGALRGLARAARLRNLWPGAAYAFVALGILSAMQGLWTLPYLTTAYPISPAAATDVLQAWSIGLLLALPAWGYVADRVLRSNKRTLLASLGLQAAPWLLLCLAPAAWPADALFALFLFLALTNGCWMPAYALVNRAAPAELRGSALGLLNLAFFLGAACFQQASGALLTWLTPGPGPAPLDAYRWLFALFLAALGLAALALTAAREPRR
jgi:MFS family permease